MNASDEGYGYEQVASAIRDAILAKTVKSGEKLPTQGQLCEQYDVSRNVVRQALRLLENEGLIDGGRGGRATVREHDRLVRRSALHYRSSPGAPFAEEALKTERMPRYSHQTRPTQASLEVASRLGIGIGDDVMHTEYTSYADDEPMMIVNSYEPLAITRGTPIERPEEGTLMGAGIVDRFTSIGLRPTVVVERLHSRMPHPTEMDNLELKPGVPIIIIIRTCYSGDTPIETAELVLAADQYHLEYETRVDPLPSVTRSDQHIS